MKTKILLSVIILFFIVGTTNAQINKDRILLGGGINYNSTSNPNQQSFYSNLQIGKVIKENTVVGLIGGYSSNTSSYNNGSPVKARSYSAGVFYRKYKRFLSDFYFFGEVDGSYNFSNNIQESYNSGLYLNSKSRGATISFVPGVAYAVCKRMQMELSMPSFASLSYAHSVTIDNSLPAGVSPQKRNTYGAGINLNSNLLYNFAIGFKFLLGK